MAISKFLRPAIAVLALGFLAACDDDARLPRNSRHYVPIPGPLLTLMAQKETTKHQPILFRTFKEESELEVWKQKLNGEYVLLKTYPMCRWSGQLGPKVREGDRQVPEGFYSITPAQLNPNSSFYLSFNIGYPNAYDRAQGRTGAHIMVHGACSSAGCFSMTDEQIAEIYAMTRESFGGGQKAIQLQSYPFRFTPQNMAKYRADPNMPFWKTLKEGSDSFEVTKRETQVSVCERRYVFNRTAKDGAKFEASYACPPSEIDQATASAVASKAQADETKIASLVSGGTKAVRRIYKDGDQHHSFKAVRTAGANEGQMLNRTQSSATAVAVVSRPDDLDHGPVEIAVDELKGKANKSARELASTLPVKRDEPAAVTTAAAAPSATPATARAFAAQPSRTATPAATQATATPGAQQATPSRSLLGGWLGWGDSGASTSNEVKGNEQTTPQKVDVPAPPRPGRQAGTTTRDRSVDAGALATPTTTPRS